MARDLCWLEKRKCVTKQENEKCGRRREAPPGRGSVGGRDQLRGRAGPSLSVQSGPAVHGSKIESAARMVGSLSTTSCLPSGCGGRAKNER